MVVKFKGRAGDSMLKNWGNKEMPPETNRITGVIVSSAIAVHSVLGPGLLESAYEACLVHELLSKGLRVERQVPFSFEYDGVKVDAGYRLDLLVEKQVIVEIKAVEKIVNLHLAQLMTYLKLSKLKVGLVLNFNAMSMKNGIRRVAL
jgi:GxxExxY protein